MSSFNQNPAEDGITHINISRAGKTRLGRLLHPGSDVPLEHPEMGSFRSHETFRQWLRTGGASFRLRHMLPEEAREAARKMKTVRLPQEKFEDQMCEALYYKIVGNEELSRLMQESVKTGLPFTSYTTIPAEHAAPEIRDHTSTVGWMFFYLDLVRKTL